MKNRLKPHGVDVSCSYQILGSRKKTLPKSKLEGYIEIENLKHKKKLVLPMRSFVNGFMDSLHGMLSGDAEADTKLKSISTNYYATAGSLMGIILGIGESDVQLSNASLHTKKSGSSASMQAQHKSTTFNAPYSSATKKIDFNVRRLISNAAIDAWVINEFGVFARTVGASTASTLMLARERPVDVDGNGITFPASSDIRITFKFQATQGTTGGIVMNFARLIYNMFFYGNINRANFISKINSAPTYTYAAGAVASTSSALYIGAIADAVNGIVVGYQSTLGGSVVPDETVMTVNHTNLTVSAVTISSISQGTGSSKFTVTRDFTNTGTSNKNLDEIGVLIRGNGIGDTQSFIMINRLRTEGAIDNKIVLEPQQTLRVTYTIQIQK